MSEATTPAVPLSTIASTAGVSIPTVSKVLNARPGVAEQTRLRVLAALDTHGMPMRPLRPRSAGVIDLRVENLLGAWSEEVVRGVVASAREDGLDVVLSVGSAQDRSRAWITRALRRGTEGFISVVASPSAQECEIASGLPIVVVDPWTTTPPLAMTVKSTNWRGAMDATTHLIELGHTSIATITGDTALDNALARLAGYRSAMERAGLRIDPDLIRHGDYTARAGYRAAQYLLGLPDRPTAIFAASDDMAIGAIRALHEAGLRIPHDVSVVGFDDLPSAQWMEPGLTTVRQPLELMGVTAVRMLRGIHTGDAVRRVELETELVVRGTTRPPTP